MPGDVPRWLDDRTGIESADGHARQQGSEEKEVLGTDNHLANDNVIKIIPPAPTDAPKYPVSTQSER